MSRPLHFAVFAGLWFTWACAGRASADVFYVVSHNDLRVSDAALPESEELSWQQRQSLKLRRPYAVLEGAGEVYVVPGTPADVLQRQRDAALPGTTQPRPFTVAVRRETAGDVAGTVFVASADGSAMVPVPFVIAGRYGKTTADEHKRFLRVKQRHFEDLLDENIPGGAWFRRLAREAAFERLGKQDELQLRRDEQTPRRPSGRDFEDSFALFSGGRAIRENLQLDRLVMPDSKGAVEPTVEIDSLEGITVAEIDWQPRLEGTAPRLDPLAKFVPHDQHALFFPNFRALVTMADQARDQGTPVLQFAQQRTEDAGVLQRYERQMCLELDDVARRLGELTVGSAAITGSDPYLPTGTDVAVLLETEQPAALEALIKARQEVAARTVEGTERLHGEIGGLAYTAVVSPRREVCSYLVVNANVVLVTNSKAQVERFAKTTAGRSQSLADLPEFRFFRHRYPREDADETAFLMLTDATIRRWCGPKWRIASGRRNRAGAIMADYQAKYLAELVRGDVEPTRLDTTLYVPQLGQLRLSGKGVSSSTYGTLEFQTPIAELEMPQVSKTEADAYERWRDNYQSYWRRFFDPIGVRFTLKEERLAADVSVIPLIAGTDYREFLQLTLGGKLTESSGDRHPEALAHAILAIQPQSPLIRQGEGIFGAMGGNFGPNPLGWLGSSIELYIDEDPFWMDAAAAEDTEKFFEENFHRLPIAFRADVSDNLKLALFLTGVRTMVNQAAPGLVTWENRQHGETSYVVIAPAQGAANESLGRLRLYYATSPGSFVLSLNENVIQRFLDRAARPATEQAEAKPDDNAQPAMRAWKGENVGFQMRKEFVRIIAGGIGKEFNRHMQERSWRNLPVLNSYRRHFPDAQPLQIHEQFWQTRLLCPGGGEYVWNDEFHTYESTVYGHPGQPKDGPSLSEQLASIALFNAGLTFEDDGLRAVVEIELDGDEGK